MIVRCSHDCGFAVGFGVRTVIGRDRAATGGGDDCGSGVASEYDSGMSVTPTVAGGWDGEAVTVMFTTAPFASATRFTSDIVPFTRA